MPKPSLEDQLLRAALDYARQGYRVLRLRPGTKIPMDQEWQINATTDAETIALWWSEVPTANIGLATGKDSDLWVLDIDSGHGKAAKKSLKALEKAHGPLSRAYKVRTPSGGGHLYFRWPKGEGVWRNKASTVLGPGLDIRADGGQVAAWPSRLSDGNSYAIVSADRPPRVPRWLAGMTKTVAPVVPVRPRIDPASLGDADKDRLGRYTVSTVNALLDDLRDLQRAATANPFDYKGAPWNDTCFRVACRLQEFAATPWAPLGDDDAYQGFFAAAPRDSDFTDQTVATIWASAAKRVGGKELAVPDVISAGLVLPFDPETGEPLPTPGAGALRYFTGKNKTELLAYDLAETVKGDLAIGTDRGVWSFEGGVWLPNDDVVKRRVVEALGNRYRPAHFSAVNDIVLTSPDLPRLTGEPHPEYVNTRTGMLEWRSGVLKAHDPNYLSTTQLHVDFDPAADCPLFDRYVSEVVSPDSVQLLWEVIGYMLISGNPLQKAILLSGDGGTGKGTLIRVLQHMIGAENVSNVTLRSMSEGKFETAELFGKHANLAGDIDARFLKDTSVFKGLTGQDMVQVQRKGGRPFSFVCWAVPLFSANQLWKSSDNTNGYRRRWVQVPFPNKVSGSLDETRLYAESSGILNKALAAVRHLMAQGEFTLGVSATLLREEFERQSDVVRVWLDEDDHVMVTPTDADDSAAHWSPRTELHRAFKDWASDAGHGILSSTSFYQRLDQLGYPAARRPTGRGYYGLRLDRVSAVGGFAFRQEEDLDS